MPSNRFPAGCQKIADATLNCPASEFNPEFIESSEIDTKHFLNQALAVAGQKLLRVPQGEFELYRNPRDQRLQAWDAADELLLNYIDERQFLTHRGRLLIFNDSFGALAVALAEYPVFSWNDSFMAQRALADNLSANGYPPDQVKTNQGIELPSVSVDCVLIKIPKTLALLEHQLYALRPLLQPHSHIVAAGMTRHIHRSTLEFFSSLLGPTTTTRARKKSRLIIVQRDHSLNQGQSRFPDSYELQVGQSYRLINHASLFSRDRLDRGSRLMIENMPLDERFRHIVDLGCGNGVLGIIAAALNPAANLTFSDESHMAIASAESNFRNAFAQTRNAAFIVADGLSHLPGDSQNLVLVNPPFHHRQQTGDAIAWQMFKDARRALLPGGELRVVGNRHLGYHAKLKKLFGRCETVAADSKFVVLRSY